MRKLKNWVGLCALLLSLQAHSTEISVQDSWIRTLNTGQEDAMVGMVITSSSHARIIGVISPAYKFVAMQGPGKNGASKTQEIEFIDLPAQKAVVLGAEGMHMLLLGSRHTQGAADNIPVIFTVQFDDKTSKIITIMTQFEGSNSAATMPLSNNDTAQPSTVVPPVVQQAPSKPKPIQIKPVVASKPPVAEVKPLKAASVAMPKPKPVPAPVAVNVVATPLPVADVAPKVVPLAVEPKKAPEAKLVEQPKQVEAQASDECLGLARELRECGRLNDMMVAWCETEAKSRYDCQLSMEQLKKLKN